MIAATVYKTPINERHHRHGSEAATYLCGFLDDDHHDDGVMVLKQLATHRHVENPIGIGI
jgi:hypothetical protein